MVATDLVKANPEALKVWKITDKFFKESGIQEKVDIPTFEMYCLAVSEYREMVDRVNDGGDIDKKKQRIKVEVILRNNAAKMTIVLAQQLGIDRKTRIRGYSTEVNKSQPNDRAAGLMKRVA